MRYVVIGLGAIGGTLAAALHTSGQQVLGIARGAHADAIESSGLLVRRPGREERVNLSLVRTVADAQIGEGDCVINTVKSHDSLPVLEQLADCAPSQTPLVCAQNGVANEPAALRWFANVYGLVVMCPAVHLEPGVVAAYPKDTIGIFDLGRWPSGSDETSEQIAADLTNAGYESKSVDDISRWKYAKLITNLGNAVEVVCGPHRKRADLVERLHAEAYAVLDRAGIDYVSAEDDRRRRGDIIELGSIDGPRPGGSTWQSIARGQGRTEVDYLCGEIVRLARLNGESAPLNGLMQHLTHEIAAGRLEPESLTEQDVLARAQ